MFGEVNEKTSVMSRKILPLDSVKLVESDKGEYWGDAYGQTLN